MRIDASILPSNRRPGCRAELHPDGTLKSFAFTQGSTCIAILEVDEAGVRGQFRHGIAGEVYYHGIIEPIGPFAGSAAPRSTRDTLADWVRRQIQTIDALAAGRGRVP